MRLLNIALLSSVLLLAGTTLPAMAGTAGVTAAVNPEASGTPPGGAVRTIVLGDNILTDEKIDTGPGGLVQVLLADGTTFTVGPNSSLTIDKFVYDPNANTAQVTASLARGVFRFIGGRTSKTEGGVEINTPVGTVGIRGAVADISLTPNGQELKAQIDLLFGKEVTLTGAGGLLERIYKAGYSIIIGQDGRASLVKTPPGAAGGIQQALAGKPGTNGGTGNPPTDEEVGNSDVPGDNSDKTPHDNAPPDFSPPDLDAILLATIDFFDTHDNAKDILGTDNPGGFGAGYVTVYNQQVPGAVVVQNSDPADVQIGFGPNTAVLSGLIPFEEGSIPVELELGFDNPTTATVRTDGIPDTQVGVINTKTVESGLLCEACNFIKWGYWDSSIPVDDGVMPVAQGTYVTGDITKPGEFDKFAGGYGEGVVATYAGTAEGLVHTGGNTYAASGDMNMTFNLGDRSGTLSISGFDTEHIEDGLGWNYSIAQGEGGVSGQFHGSEEFGGVSGAFVNSPTSVAAGVIGNFGYTTEVYDGVEGYNNYSATGVFGGSFTGTQTPH